MSANSNRAKYRTPAPRIAILCIVLIWIALPLVLPDYTLYRISQAGVFALAIVGLNLLIGQSGQLSVGHSAFFALGAYVVALTSGEHGQYAYLSLLAAGVFCFVAGFAFGWSTLRLGNMLLLLATWGLALALPQLLKSSHLEGLTPNPIPLMAFFIAIILQSSFI